jgi:endonuclease YncB( thermonuclease family)
MIDGLHDMRLAGYVAITKALLEMAILRGKKMTAMLLILMIGQITGRVVDVYDGDSITIRTADDTVKIRLLHIDAPERGQAYGTAAR